MEMKNRIIISLMAALLAWPCVAQRQKAAVKKKAAPVVEVSEEELRFLEMLEATQKVMFIDSVVVDKEAFLLRRPAVLHRLRQPAG